MEKRTVVAVPGKDELLYRFSKNRIRKTTIGTTVVLVLPLLLFLSGCATQETAGDSNRLENQAESEVGRENYTRVMQQGEIVGYVGSKIVTVIKGGSKTTTTIHNVYGQGFQVLGSYDEAGSTHRFTKTGPVKLGNFSTEQSFRQITGIEGALEFREGLQ